ncbi:competence protein ComEA [Formosa sp. Hel1_33_131]|jgi:DNA uptake protein ComE-like DNA-binding protein|uniref:ComEA family DNA-binding protein n=1 Tax=Formosa sp. Hel1_33_131 TaxID=1336794 RepID=UPI00084E2F7E|nr:helix-hairpin-helix domain-containing protein [Formosa sp. Hel1_33_131]AOR29156.1 competence protein ComEA [Formosa sp. Hel1_33_131]
MKFYTYFSRQQRLAVIVLMLVIISMQLSWVSYNELRADTFDIAPETYLKFQKEVDSLIAKQRQNSAPKIYPFNPNYITDYKGYSLGMSAEEINRLHAYRAKNKWVNTNKEFQRITNVSDSLLKKIAPYFKFPDWVTKSTKKSSSTASTSTNTFAKKIDLNKATAKQLQKVHGIGAFYSERIVRLRDSFEGGFISDLQLQGIQGLTPEVIVNILKDFTVKTPRVIEKIDLNSATIAQLVSIEYIDYELAYEIIELRMLRDGYSAIEELTKVKDFPTEKLEIIKLYLSLN